MTDKTPAEEFAELLGVASAEPEPLPPAARVPAPNPYQASSGAQPIRDPEMIARQRLADAIGDLRPAEGTGGWVQIIPPLSALQDPNYYS